MQDSPDIVKEKERFEALFEYASMGILVANEKGIIEMVNTFLLHQFGYDQKDELIGKEVEVLIPRRYEQVHHKHRDNYNRKPERRPMGVGRDLFAVRKDGTEFPVEVSLSNYAAHDGIFIIAFVIDITTRKEIENAVFLQKEQLAEKNLKIKDLNQGLEQQVELRTKQLREAMKKVEASHRELTLALNKEKELGDLKSRFVSMASHEFRTPLSTILSSASLLAKYTETIEQENRNRHIDRIKNSVHNLTSILNDFLSIGKIEDGKVEPNYTAFNVKEFVENVCNEMRGLARPRQKIECRHTGQELIFLDESLLRNIIFNLVSNAIKFTGEGGQVQVSSVVTANEFTMSVRDNGIGISPADQEHLFERFFRASNATNIQGTGLGLHIVAKYVELMNGSIQLSSELDKGTCFTIQFNHTL